MMELAIIGSDIQEVSCLAVIFMAEWSVGAVEGWRGVGMSPDALRSRTPPTPQLSPIPRPSPLRPSPPTPQVVGSAIAINILFGLDLWIGCLITGLDTFTFLAIHQVVIREQIFLRAM